MKTTTTTTAAEKALTEEQYAFADANFGLVIKACDVCHIPEELREDCIQAGWEVLLRKIPDFDSSRAKFSTFIFPWLRNAFNDVIKADGDGMVYKPRNAIIRVISMDKTMAADSEGNTCTLSELLPGNEDTERAVTEGLMNEQLYRCLLRLDEREQFILKHYYNLGNCLENGMSLREIALALGTTRTTVSNVMARAEQKLRAMLEYGAGMRHAA